MYNYVGNLKHHRDRPAFIIKYTFSFKVPNYYGYVTELVFVVVANNHALDVYTYVPLNFVCTALTSEDTCCAHKQYIPTSHYYYYYKNIFSFVRTLQRVGCVRWFYIFCVLFTFTYEYILRRVEHFARALSSLPLPVYRYDRIPEQRVEQYLFLLNFYT